MSLRVGFLGAGLIARYHAMQLRLTPEPHRITSVFDPDTARARSFADDEGGRAVGSIEEVVADCDAVFVCSWTAAHDDGVAAAVDAGVAVFCEKPLATDLPGALELADRVAAADVVNAVGLVLRSSPALWCLRELIHEPSAGRIMNVVFRDDQYLPTQGMYGSTWRGERRLAGSGTLLEHSIHDVDLLEWLVGPALRVGAHQASFHGLDGIEDSVTAWFGFEGGASATLTSVWHDVLSRPSQRRIEVFCERAVVTLEGEYFGPVHIQTSDDRRTLDGDELMAWLAERGIELRSTETEFLAQVRRSLAGEPVERVRPDVADAVRAHRVVDALYRSAADGGSPVGLA